jgi:hypothetical protein
MKSQLELNYIKCDALADNFFVESLFQIKQGIALISKENIEIPCTSSDNLYEKTTVKMQHI